MDKKLEDCELVEFLKGIRKAQMPKCDFCRDICNLELVEIWGKCPKCGRKAVKNG